ncbi:hypothetical protein quinque_009262 [Culex quinquefasciatus]
MLKIPAPSKKQAPKTTFHSHETTPARHTTRRRCSRGDLFKQLDDYLYRSGLIVKCVEDERSEQPPAGPCGHQLPKENPGVTNISSSGRLARLRQQKLAVQEALLKKRQELNDLQAQIEQDRRKLQMRWEMRYEGVAGNSTKAEEEQEEESRKDELRDRVRGYEVGSTMVKLTETMNVVSEKLFVTASESCAGVDDTELPAGKFGSDRALAGFLDISILRSSRWKFTG